MTVCARISAWGAQIPRARGKQLWPMCQMALCQIAFMRVDLTDVRPPSKDIRPESCSRCRGSAVAPIVYGLPDAGLMESASRGEVEIGGCVVGPQEWACVGCGYTWPLPPE